MARYGILKRQLDTITLLKPSELTSRTGGCWPLLTTIHIARKRVRLLLNYTTGASLAYISYWQLIGIRSSGSAVKTYIHCCRWVHNVLRWNMKTRQTLNQLHRAALYFLRLVHIKWSEMNWSAVCEMQFQNSSMNSPVGIHVFRTDQTT